MAIHPKPVPRRLRVLGAACGLGYPDPGSAQTPDRLRLATLPLWREDRLGPFLARLCVDRHGARYP